MNPLSSMWQTDLVDMGSYRNSGTAGSLPVSNEVSQCVDRQLVDDRRKAPGDDFPNAVLTGGDTRCLSEIAQQLQID
jgi:hypothetical protein